MFSGVVKLSVPISSSLPQRPQFLQRSAAFLTSARVSLRFFALRVSYAFGAFADAVAALVLAGADFFDAMVGAFLFWFWVRRRRALESSQSSRRRSTKRERISLLKTIVSRSCVMNTVAPPAAAATDIAEHVET